MRRKVVPENFSTLLLKDYRNYGDSVEHKNAFQYFAKRILPAVNTSHTKYDKRKYTKTISESFTYTDEAFALMLVVNYEGRWVSQYTAAEKYGGGRLQKDQSQYWVNARYTSSNEGSRRGVSWSKEGLRRFNSLAEKVKAQRDQLRTGTMVEENLRSWFREETGMTVLNKEGEETLENEVGEDEEEVEALGECGIFSL
jgi:hypothetical protein